MKHSKRLLALLLAAILALGLSGAALADEADEAIPEEVIAEVVDEAIIEEIAPEVSFEQVIEAFAALAEEEALPPIEEQGVVGRSIAGFVWSIMRNTSIGNAYFWVLRLLNVYTWEEQLVLFPVHLVLAIIVLPVFWPIYIVNRITDIILRGIWWYY